jgi:hypothetical protein
VLPTWKALFSALLWKELGFYPVIWHFTILISTGQKIRVVGLGFSNCQ